MNGPHDKDETEPGDVLFVVLQGIMSVPIHVWIEVVSHLTLDLHATQKEDRAEHLAEENK